MKPVNASTEERVGAAPLAIVGMGCLFPMADGLESFWANIKEKVDGIGPIPATHWDPADFFDADQKRPDFTYARRGGFLDPYPFAPAEFGISPRDLEAIDTAQLLGLVVAKMALADAGMLAEGVNRRRISVILGVTGTLEMVVPLGARLGHPLWRKAMTEAGISNEQADKIAQRIGDGYVGWQENSFPGLLGNVVAGRIANRLDLGGTNCVVDAACASSLSAIHLAALELQAGRADAVLTGGVDTFNDIFMYMCFSKTPALSPTGDARPFSEDADGTILGEGLGMMVLKRLADAEKAGDRIYAVIRGIGTSSDGAGNAVYAPAAEGQERCLRDAYHRSHVDPATVELIEAHGTGTKVGDAAELEGLSRVFSEHAARRKSVALGSIKSQVGHTKAAAGAAGIVKAVLALRHKTLPPTIKVKAPPAEVDEDSSFYVNAEARPWFAGRNHPRRAGVSSFGFGGSNFHCVLEEHESTAGEPDFAGASQILTWSSETIDELRNQFDRDAKTIERDVDWDDIRRMAVDRRSRFDGKEAHRLVIVVDRTRKSLAQTLNTARRSLQIEPRKTVIATAEGVFLGHGPPSRLGMLFPGQGSQSVGMMRELACSFPIFQQVLVEANDAFAAGLVDADTQRLTDFIYPPSVFASDDRKEQDRALRDTSVAQPALGAVSLASLQVLRYFGIQPDATAGHSFGELTALCAAGCYDAPSLFALSQLRGRLMAQNDGDRGAMLAVMAPIEDVENIVRQERVDVVVANRNAPTQAVLSGATLEIERAEQTFKRRKVHHVRLPVAAAFHSPLVASASGPFRAALEPIDFQEAQLPVFANSTSREYPRDPQSIRDLLAAQLSRPVDFVQQIRNMVQSGVRTFLEVGPNHTLTRLVGSILGDEPHHALALDGSSGQRMGLHDLATTLGALAALGHAVELQKWSPNAPPVRVPKGPVFPICGANYRSPKPKLASAPTKSALSKIEPSSPPPTKIMTKPAERPVESKPTTSNVDAGQLQRALQVSQDSLAAFQRLQEQTAELHRVFLEQQTQAQQTLQQLLTGQQQLLAAGLKLPAPIPVPQPVAVIARPIAPRPDPVRFAPPVVPPVDLPLPKPVAPPAPPSPPVASPPIRQSDDLMTTLLAIVAEKTGYPVEMLNPDMGLDADLGIDSIKRVEILSALQEQRPDTPVVPPDRLGALRTLREVVDLLKGPTTSIAPVHQQHFVPDTRINSTDVTTDLLAVVAEKTGYPVDMLNLDMGLDNDLGIDSIKRVEILSALQERLPDTPTVAADRLGALRTLRDVADILSNGSAEKKNPRQPVMA